MTEFAHALDQAAAVLPAAILAPGDATTTSRQGVVVGVVELFTPRLA